MDKFWDSIKAFFAGLGHNFMGYIIDALPSVKQLALQAIAILIDEAIAWVEGKFAVHANELKSQAPSVLQQGAKRALDNDRRNAALDYIKAKMAENPDAYPKELTDSLINTGIELGVQKMKTQSEGNHGNFPGGNSNG